MNTGTKLRTIASLIFSINSGLVMLGFNPFEGVTEDMIYGFVSIVGMLVTWFSSHFFNNDYTKEAAEGTGMTRYLKAVKRGKINA